MKTRIVLASLLLASAATLLPAQNKAAAPKSAWNVTDHIALKDFVVQSHRGAGFLAEENTIESFEIGWKHGTIPEADVRTTKDGVIVSFHDGNFKRVVKDAPPELAKLGVKDVTYHFLSMLDVGSWKGEEFAGRRTPTMAELFKMIQGRPDRKYYLDIKQVNIPDLAKLVRDMGVDKQVIFTSKHPKLHVEWKKLMPHTDNLMWMSANEEKINEMFDKLEASGDIKYFTQVQLHVHPNKDKTSTEPYNHRREFIIKLGERLRKHGILYQSLPYTDDEGVYAALMDLGVASFATDYPIVTMREIKKYYAKHGKK